jgi:hypothetical protein
MRRDVRRAMETARAMILMVVVLPVVVAFAWVVGPGGPSPVTEMAPWYVSALPWVGIGLYLIGLAWMVRIYRSRPDASRSTLRSRGRSPVPVPAWSRNGHTPASRENRASRVEGTMREDVARAQGLARAMITLAVFLGVLMVFLWIATPGSIGGMFYQPTWLERALPSIGWAAYLVGLAWMTRIYRSRPETSRTDWRYRSER